MPERSIIGHRKQLLQLSEDLKQGNLAHAYLFAGAPSIGKTTVARWFAGQILAQDVPEGEQELLRHQLDRLIHPDLLILDQLWIEEKCEDWAFIAQSSNVPQQHRAKDRPMRTDTIGIDDVREIQRRLQETGNLPHRVCIIRSVERMQDAAANAFLKILEEPPAGRIFLLTTEALSTLRPTVLSRTRVLRFEGVGDREMQAILQGVSAEDASFILHVAQGAPGIAIDLMHNPDRLREEKLRHTQAAAFWGAPTLLERIKLLAPLLERGPEADRFLFHLSLALREVPDYKSGEEEALRTLIQHLRTNAWRPLLIQHFALSVEEARGSC